MLMFDIDEDIDEDTTENQWVKEDPGRVGSNIPPILPVDFSEEDKLKLEKLKTALDYYLLFQSDEWLSVIVEESRKYAISRGMESKLELINVSNLRCAEAVLLHTGYHQIPQRKMVWERSGDCHNPFIADAIRRDTFDGILQCLHFRDNGEIDNDIYYKVRPIFDNLNKGSKFFLPGSHKFSVDEIMIPYFGRHSTKQYIRGKPVRYGYKVWSLCTSDGAGMKFEPYCGKHTAIRDIQLGQGPNVVMDLVTKAELVTGSEVFFDNLFTSFPLLEKLSEAKIAGTGTMRVNRLKKVPIKQKKDLSKKSVPRGELHTVYRADQVLVGWKDNKAVYVSSNKFGGAATGTCKRFNRTERKFVDIPCPDVVVAYNGGMGGVDLLDNMVARHRIQLRKKKWWFPIYSWSLNVCSVNAWRMRQRMTGKKEPYLPFLRELVVELLSKYGSQPHQGRRSLVTAPREIHQSIR